MKFFLSYVNERTGTDMCEKEFETMIQLMAWVNEKRPDWTSYQIIVTKVNPRQY